ncbi:hypothetical protein TELCIR_22855 [Teladorsagia circumcincta]|uniref:Reverse transcriptase domain-containing protein n=1 Tax=Teladorsagia circumcincta TaxID=45464 RepID=A0A2G9TCR0_TELCI|nr:hypothetical protein TELCIR_22855 [Teladorsagia circumcincta]
MEGGQVDRDVTGSTTLIKMKTGAVPLGVRAKLKELLADLMTGKLIEPSNPEWTFAIVLVRKKDGSTRLCIDYRELNKNIKLDAFPLPSIEAALQSLSGKNFFNIGYVQWVLAIPSGGGSQRENSVYNTGRSLPVQSHTVWFEHQSSRISEIDGFCLGRADRI